MTRACFLDLYNTLAYYDPTREERQALACGQFGIQVSAADLRRAYVEGEHFWSQENGRSAIQRRPREEQRRFFAEYERRLLAVAGIEVSDALALDIYRAYRSTEASLRLFDDVLPALRDLREGELVVAVVSNWERDLRGLCEDLGLAPYLDFSLSSAEVGVEKPDVRIFQEALRRAGVAPSEAAHVGDQYHSDVVGARAAGIQPVLLDRLGFLSEFDDCPRVRTLLEVRGLLVGEGEATPS